MHHDNNNKNSKNKNKLVYATIIFAAISLTMMAAPTIVRAGPASTSHFDTIQTFQDEKHIVVTITKNGTATEGPIIVIPPPEGGKNGTIITPGENTTKENPGNVTVITPGGNVTEIPNGNVTNIDNGTVIVPPDRNITETPGNVTVIDPPAPPIKPETNQTTPPTHCTCNQTNASIPSVIVTPAPGQNVTTQHPTPTPIPAPPANTTTTTNSTTTNTNSTTSKTDNATNSIPPTTATNSTSTNSTKNSTKVMPPGIPP